MKIRNFLKNEVLRLIETDSKAAQDAKAKGLEYMSFGRWGKNGEVTHKTDLEQDRLIPFQTGATPTSQGAQSSPSPTQPSTSTHAAPTTPHTTTFDPNKPMGGTNVPRGAQDRLAALAAAAARGEKLDVDWNALAADDEKQSAVPQAAAPVAPSSEPTIPSPEKRKRGRPPKQKLSATPEVPTGTNTTDNGETQITKISLSDENPEDYANLIKSPDHAGHFISRAAKKGNGTIVAAFDDKGQLVDRWKVDTPDNVGPTINAWKSKNAIRPAPQSELPSTNVGPTHHQDVSPNSPLVQRTSADPEIQAQIDKRRQKPPKEESMKNFIRHEIVRILEGERAHEKAMSMGLDYMNFGRYGKNGVVTYVTDEDNDELIPFEKATGKKVGPPGQPGGPATPSAKTPSPTSTEPDSDWRNAGKDLDAKVSGNKMFKNSDAHLRRLAAEKRAKARQALDTTPDDSTATKAASTIMSKFESPQKALQWIGNKVKGSSTTKEKRQLALIARKMIAMAKELAKNPDEEEYQKRKDDTAWHFGPDQ